MARTARPVRSLITPCVRFFRESGRHFYLINAVRSAATVIRRPGTIVKLNELGSPERHNVCARAQNCRLLSRPPRFIVQIVRVDVFFFSTFLWRRVIYGGADGTKERLN